MLRRAFVAGRELVNGPGGIRVRVEIKAWPCRQVLKSS